MGKRLIFIILSALILLGLIWYFNTLREPSQLLTYRNDQYGFEFKYPDSELWKVESTDPASVPFYGGILRLSLLNASRCSYPISDVILNVLDIKSGDFQFYFQPELATGAPDLIYRYSNDRFYNYSPVGEGMSEDEFVNSLRGSRDGILRNSDGRPIFRSGDAETISYLLLGRQKGIALQINASYCPQNSQDADWNRWLSILEQITQSLRFFN